jgi:hypothetical protein
VESVPVGRQHVRTFGAQLAGRHEHVIDAGLSGKERAQRRLVGQIGSNRLQPIARSLRRVYLGRIAQALGRLKQAALGPPGDRDESSLGQGLPGRLQADPRASADDRHAFPVEFHGEILLSLGTRIQSRPIRRLLESDCLWVLLSLQRRRSSLLVARPRRRAHVGGAGGR